MWSPKDLISLLYVLMSFWPSDQNVPLTNFNSMMRFLRICRLNSLWASMEEVCCHKRAADVSTLTTTSRQMNTDYSYRGILQENGHSEKKMTRKKLSEHVLWPVILYSSSPYCLRPRPLRSIIYLSSCSLQIFLFYVFITAQCCWTCVGWQ